MDEEIWKDVIGYEGLYKISNLGSLIRIGKNNEKIVSYVLGKYGHKIITLSKKSIQRTHNLSRLVGIHFIKNPLNFPCVLHKDETLDENGFLYNGADNLYWGTYGDNTKDKFRKGRANNNFIKSPLWKGKFGKDHNKSIKIIQYDLNGNLVKEWDSATEVQKELLIKQSNITQCCKGNRKSAGGFIWRYDK